MLQPVLVNSSPLCNLIKCHCHFITENERNRMNTTTSSNQLSILKKFSHLGFILYQETIQPAENTRLLSYNLISLMQLASGKLMIKAIIGGNWLKILQSETVYRIVSKVGLTKYFRKLITSHSRITHEY